jgi:hypothetical protein
MSTAPAASRSGIGGSTKSRGGGSFSRGRNGEAIWLKTGVATPKPTIAKKVATRTPDSLIPCP